MGINKLLHHQGWEDESFSFESSFKVQDVLIQLNETIDFYDIFHPPSHAHSPHRLLNLSRSSTKKVFKLNPIIYLKLLADHYLFSALFRLPL